MIFYQHRCSIVGFQMHSDGNFVIQTISMRMHTGPSSEWSQYVWNDQRVHSLRFENILPFSRLKPIAVKHVSN